MADNDKGDVQMNLDNVFYFKKIVDALYPDEDRPAVDIQSVVDEVKENVKNLNDTDFSEVIIRCVHLQNIIMEGQIIYLCCLWQSPCELIAY